MAKGLSINSAKALAEEIRVKVEENAKTFFIDFSVSISIGVVSAEGFENLASAIAEADTMLYEAKGLGRNVVVCQNG